MKVSSENRQKAMSLMATDEGAALELISHCSLTLKAPGFLAGAVACMSQKDGHLRDRALIATSKQNLLRLSAISTDLVPPDLTAYESKSLLREFVSRVQIHYGSDQVAAIDHVATFEVEWTNDLCLLVSYDPELVAHTTRYGIYGNMSRIQDHRRYYLGNNEKPFFLIQTGLEEEGSGALLYRLTLPQSEVFQDLKQIRGSDPGRELVFSDALPLEADAENSLGSDDVGSPLFAVYNPKGQDPQVYLLGLNLGCNYGQEPIAAAGPIVNNAITRTQPIIQQTFLELDHSA